MKNFKELDEFVFKFGADNNYFADKYSGRMAPGIRAQVQEIMFTSFVKEIEAIAECEKVDIKYKTKFYNKLTRVKKKLINLDRADAWFDKVFQKYFNRGILEHLIVYAISFLYKKDLFVPKRLFKQINNNDMLAEFTAVACEYLGWTKADFSAEQSVADEATNSEEDTETEATADDTQEAESDDQAQEEADDFVPCEKCQYCTCDENDEYYCTAYNQELDPERVADARQCED